jgi:hypothetical protein
MTRRFAVKLTKPFRAYYWRLRSNRYATQIARQILPELRQTARRKMGSPGCSKADIRQYTEVRAAQLAQPLVDEILRANPRFPGFLGNEMIVSAARKAAALVAKTAGREPVAA